ncbi:LysR family transcriptional regulator [Thiotrichales bacterium 19S3-7]|nr:LysR family transcriptional regulator [Thiotrichales bacterium 19S3-7]MCF6801933.1 LysR family transcriptional regulator [Thiotrichales bacterium 19S3-11]
MTINDLKVLKTIIDEKSISKAALKLHLSQPAVSNILRKLRSELEDELFIRNRDNLILTTKAKEIYIYIEEILKNYQLIFKQDKTYRPETDKVKYRIATSLHFIDFFVEDLFKVIEQYNYTIKVELSILPTHHKFHKLDSYYDFIIAINSAPNDYIRKVLLNEKMVVAHLGALDSLTKPLSLTEYYNLKHIVYYTENNPYSYFQLKDKDPRNVVFAANTPAEVLFSKLLNESLVITIAESYAKHFNLKYVALPKELDDMNSVECMYYPMWSKQSASYQWFKNLIINIIKNNNQFIKQ